MRGITLKKNIQRYIKSLILVVKNQGWPLLKIRKYLKICQTNKLISGEKWCLAFHVSKKIMEFGELGGITAKELKEHVNLVGGIVVDFFAGLVKESVGDIDEVCVNDEDLAI